jgi:hypothetical protein
MDYVKSFDVLGIETAQVACIELQGAPNAATVGAVGLLGIDVTSENYELYKCVKVNGSVYTWEQVTRGQDGVSIVKAEINGNGELVITLSNGKTLNAGVAKGADGRDGNDGLDGRDGFDGLDGRHGVGVSTVRIDNGRLIVTLSDGREINTGVVKGEKGDAGIQGIRGEQGVGIQSVEQTRTATEDEGANVIIVTLTNGQSGGTFYVRNGSKGDQGIQGEKGDKGDQGEQGIQGVQGIQGEKGSDAVTYRITGDVWGSIYSGTICTRNPVDGMTVILYGEDGNFALGYVNLDGSGMILIFGEDNQLLEATFAWEPV